jgi:hypothetical protein
MYKQPTNALSFDDVFFWILVDIRVCGFCQLGTVLICSIFRALIRFLKCINNQQMPCDFMLNNMHIIHN